MKNIFGWLISIGAIFLLMFSTGSKRVYGEELCFPLGALTLSAPQGVESKRGKVTFPHDAHFNYSCKKCHHTWTGDRNLTGCSVSGCHDSMVPLLTTKPDQSWRYFKNAYHKKCIACHKAIQVSNEKMEMTRKHLVKPLPKTGPLGCVQCHGEKK